MPTELADGGSFDLADSNLFVELAQNFRGVYSFDPDAPPRFCWITERYLAGEPGWSGALSIARPDGSLELSYEFEYHGLLEKLGDQVDQPDYPTEMHRGDGAMKVIASEFVEELID